MGLVIIGGLAVSQLITLYTTPALYLLLARLQRRKGLDGGPVHGAS